MGWLWVSFEGRREEFYVSWCDSDDEEEEDGDVLDNKRKDNEIKRVLLFLFYFFSCSLS